MYIEHAATSTQCNGLHTEAAKKPMGTLEELEISRLQVESVNMTAVVHSTNLAFMEEWEGSNHCWKTNKRILKQICKNSLFR